VQLVPQKQVVEQVVMVPVKKMVEVVNMVPLDQVQQMQMTPRNEVITMPYSLENTIMTPQVSTNISTVMSPRKEIRVLPGEAVTYTGDMTYTGSFVAPPMSYQAYSNQGSFVAPPMSYQAYSNQGSFVAPPMSSIAGYASVPQSVPLVQSVGSIGSISAMPVGSYSTVQTVPVTQTSIGSMQAMPVREVGTVQTVPITRTSGGSITMA
jgi:hypothetical protein